MVHVSEEYIFQSDIPLQQRIDSIYNDTSNDIGIIYSILHLTNAALEQSVLRKKYFLSPPDSSLVRIAKWVDMNTKDSIRLKKVKEIFRNDFESYLHLYVARITINPKLYDTFWNDTIIHAEPRKEMLAIRDEIISRPDNFERIGGYDTVNIEKYRLVKRMLGAYYDESVPNPLIEKVLKHLRPGGIWTDIIEDNQSYMMLKLLSENDSVYHCGVIRKVKLPFDPWFRNYVKKNIPIIFYDKKLFVTIKKMYPDLWWLKSARYEQR